MVSLGLPLGVGLGVGIPVIIALLGLLVFLIRRRRNRESARDVDSTAMKTVDSTTFTLDETPTRTDPPELQPPRGLPPASRHLHTRASMASQTSISSFHETFEFERPESRDQDLVTEVNRELTARSSTIRLAKIEETEALGLTSENALDESHRRVTIP